MTLNYLIFSLKIIFFNCPIKVCEVLRVVTLILVKSLLGFGVGVGTVIHFYDQLLHQVAPQKHAHPFGPKERLGHLGPFSLIFTPAALRLLIWL